MLALVLLLISFGTIIYLVATKRNFAIAIIAGSLILAISIPEKIPSILIDTIKDFRTIALIIIVILIKLLAVILQENGLLQDAIFALQKKLSYKGMLIAIPSLLGLLPVPGGALLSAPLVEEHAKKMSKEKMMFINLWYRHIWFIIFPLSTPLILLADLSGNNIYDLIVRQIPIFFLAFFVGYLFIKNIEYAKIKNENGNLKGLIPILIPVSIATSLSFFFSTYLSFLIALPLGIISAILIGKKIDVKTIKKGLSVTLAVAVFGIFLLKNIIFSANIPNLVSAYLTNFPAIVTISCLSFIIGLLTAHNLAAVSILYPILSPFLNDISLVSLLYISSFMGYLISPIHPCVVLTYEYFKPRFGEAYKMMLPPALAMVIITTLYYAVFISFIPQQ